MSDKNNGRSDKFFNPWVCTTTDKGRAFVVDMAAMLASAEPSRKRSRRPEDQRTWERTAEALVCDLALACLFPPPSGALVLPLKAAAWVQSSRYARHGIGRRTLGAVLDAADAMLCTVAKGVRTGAATTITPTEALKREVEARGLTAEDFGRRAGEELVILSRKVREETPEGVNAPPRVSASNVDYTDTPTTLRYRAEVERLNQFLARAPIEFRDDGLGPVNTAQRHLTRRFSLLTGQDTPQFDQGGRLFGAFWQTLERGRRRSSLYVGGERAVEVDFNGLYPRLACLRAGKPIMGDTAPYSLPGLENHRTGAKLALNALFFAPNTKRFPPTIARELPPGWRVEHVREAALKTFPTLEEFIASGAERAPVGHSLMFTESEILVRALSECIRRELWALPLHDAVIGQPSRAADLERVLMEAAEDVVGVSLPVSVKGRGVEPGP